MRHDSLDQFWALHSAMGVTSMVVGEYHGITEHAEQILTIGNPKIRRNLAFHRIVMSRCDSRGDPYKWRGNRPNTIPANS